MRNTIPLPDELTLHILHYLSPDDLLSAAHVCQHLYSLSFTTSLYSWTGDLENPYYANLATFRERYFRAYHWEQKEGGGVSDWTAIEEWLVMDEDWMPEDEENLAPRTITVRYFGPKGRYCEEEIDIDD